MSQLLRIVLAYNQIPLAPKAYHWFCSFPLLAYMCTEQTHAYKARGHANISQNYKWKPLSDILLYSCYWGSQNFPHILGLDASCDVITTRIQSKVVSQFEKWNEQPCPIYKSYIGQTNRKRNESVLLVWSMQHRTFICLGISQHHYRAPAVTWPILFTPPCCQARKVGSEYEMNGASIS